MAIVLIPVLYVDVVFEFFPTGAGTDVYSVSPSPSRSHSVAPISCLRIIIVCLVHINIVIVISRRRRRRLVAGSSTGTVTVAERNEFIQCMHVLWRFCHFHIHIITSPWIGSPFIV